MDTITRYYSNTAFWLHHVNNSGVAPVVWAENAANKKAYGIRLQINREETACLQRKISLFSQPVYAFSCDCGAALEFIPRDTIQSIHIISLKQFDAANGSNSDVSAYFKVYENYSYTTIENYLKHAYITVHEEKELLLNLDLLLTNPPASLEQDQRFKVRITLSDGRILEQETTDIKLS